MLCSVYRSVKKEGIFLYIRSGYSVTELPQDLKDLVGQTYHVLNLDLSKVTRLQQVDPKELEQRLQDEGYFLYVQDPQGFNAKLDEYYRDHRI